MPELPEVETVKNGINELLKPPVRILEARRRRANLRFTIPKKIEKLVAGQRLLGVERRAKYLFFQFKEGVLVNHLGMTGSWRKTSLQELGDHDHFYLLLSGKKVLSYRDPRRFGVIDWADSIEAYLQVKGYGPEPLSSEFDTGYLWTKRRGKNIAVKTFLMDQKTVVGIGNIYASELLYRSGVRPQRNVQKLTRVEVERIAENSKAVLQEAIQAGGSTISDFRKAGGESGYFQHQFDVYGKAGEECSTCGSLIKSLMITGRNSFYCPKCQAR